MLTSNTLIREIVARLPRGAKEFSLIQSTHIGSGTSPPIPFPEVKWPGREADHSLPSSA